MNIDIHRKDVQDVQDASDGVLFVTFITVNAELFFQWDQSDFWDDRDVFGTSDSGSRFQ